MAEVVGSAVVQETVSRAVSFVLSNREVAASKRHIIKRLEMAHTNMEFALERSSKLPITDVSLLKKRRMVERAYEECGDVLHRCKLRVQEDEKVEQGVTHSSTLRKSIHYIKSFIPSWISLKKDELSCSDVGIFELFADEARKFVRDMETGCSLAHYRFFSPLIRQLLEGKSLMCAQLRGSRIKGLLMETVRSEERGVEAGIVFLSYDRMTPNKTIWLRLLLRLSESTDVVGISIRCLQLLGPVFKPFAEVAMGELAQLPMQDVFRSEVLGICGSAQATSAAYFRPDPLCCRADNNTVTSKLGPCANDTTTSKFPAQVACMGFGCYIPAFEYNLRSSAHGAGGNVLELRAQIAPHDPSDGLPLSYAYETIGGRLEGTIGSLRQMQEMQLTNAIDLLIRQPDLTDYKMNWWSAHAVARFTLRKRTKSEIRRVAKTRCKLQIRGR